MRPCLLVVVGLIACGSSSAPKAKGSGSAGSANGSASAGSSTGSSSGAITPATPASEGTSKIGGRAIWAPLREPFLATRIRVVQSTACAISRDGRTACWGQVEHDDDDVTVERRKGMSAPHLLVGITGVIDIVHEWFYLCVAQRADAGPGGCFVLQNIGRTPPAFPSPPVELQPGREGICATMRDGSVGCVDLDGKYTAAPIRDVSRLSCSERSCCAVTKTGTVACFGEDKPKLPKLPPVTAIAIERDEGCARTTTGGAQCWGDAKTLTRASGVRDVAIVDFKPCVIGDDGSMTCTDERLAGATKVVAADYSCVLHEDGAVSCHGHNSHGELGDGGLLLSPLPVQVPGLDGDRVVDIAVAHIDACALKRRDTYQWLWCWGLTKPMDLGLVSGTLIPAQYVAACRNNGSSVVCSTAGYDGEWEGHSFPAPKGVAKIKTAALHRDASICLVDDNGAVKCRHGMSEGGVDDKWIPLAAPAPVEEIDPVAVGFCARHTDGRVSCWVDHRYDNDDDFLETTPKAPKLTLVPGIKDATMLVTGQDVACVITKSTEVWCWNADKPKPYAMPTLKGATSLGANDRHWCAIVAGDVWCWGDNFLGQLGTGTGGGRIRPEKDPVKARTAFKAVKVGTGRESTCALDDQGKVWCWGSNEHGQLGQPRLHRADGWSKVVTIGP